jgi:Flp pilus assembly protein CpaB
MNENQDYEKSPEDAVERLVHGKKASSDSTLDALGQIKPQADPAFMNHLEERLMAELSTKKTKKELAMLKRKERPTRFGRWPLTMAAAILAILLVGGWVLYANQSPTQTTSSAPSQVMNPVEALVAMRDLSEGTTLEAHMVDVKTFTPDSELDQSLVIREERLALGMVLNESIPAGEAVLTTSLTQRVMAQVPVVIAIQDIPAGMEITPDRIGVISYPADVVPRGAFESIEEVVGYVARTDIYTEEVILARKVLESSNETTSSLPANGNGKTIALVVGHQGNSDDSGASCPDGRTELSVNQEIARLLSTQLTELGYTVSLLDDGSQATSTADFTLNLHTLTCYPEEISDYQFMIPTIDIAPSLAHCIVNNYGQSEIDINFVHATGYTVNESGQPGMLVEIDALRADSTELNRIANGLTDTLNCFFAGTAQESLMDGMTPVVIPLQDIPLNTSITADMLTLTYWPSEKARDYTTANPGQWPSDNIDDVVGLNAQVFLPAFEPISRDDVSTDIGCDRSTGTCSYPIPDGYASIIYQTTDKAVLNYPAGSHVDVVIAMLFTDAGDDFATLCQGCEDGGNLVMQRTISDAIILYKELIHPDGNEEVVVMLAVPEQDVSALAWMDQADLPMMLVPHMEGTEGSVPQVQYLNPELTEDPHAVVIPLNQIESIPYGTVAGDMVTVLSDSQILTEGQVIYLGSTEYIQTVMQNMLEPYVEDAIEPYLRDSVDVIVLKISTAAEAAAINDLLTAGNSISLRPFNEATAAPTGFTIQQWFDASALSFNVGDNVDVIAQFTYLDENGEPAGMIRQRMGVDMLITEMEAGTGESAAYALVSLVEQNVPAGQMLASFQTCCHGTGTTQVLESWILVPHKSDLTAETEYFGYNQRGEPVPLEADGLAEGRYYVAMPLVGMVQSVAGGMTVGDNVNLIFTDGSSVEGQISYLGSALYAPFEMQVSVDSFRAESPRTIIVEVASPQDAAVVNTRVQAGESLTIDTQR